MRRAAARRANLERLRRFGRSRMLRLTLASLCGTLAVASLVESVLAVPPIGIDDANIFFVYAKHLAAGHGFVYNIGGERVEGFTSLLWVLVCSAAYSVAPRPESLIYWTSTLLVCASVSWTTVQIALGRISPIPRRWAALFPILIWLNLNFIAWSTLTLMETGAWACLVLVSSALSVRTHPASTRGLAACNGLLLTTRPESLVIVPLLITCHSVALARAGRRWQRAAGGLLASAGVVALLVTMFRLEYFGYPFPNTYYAKVSPSIVYNAMAGLNYVWHAILSEPWNALVVLGGVYGCGAVVGSSRPAHMLGVIGLSGLGLTILTGGDHFGAHRFFQHYYPPLCLATLSAAPLIRRAAPGGSKAPRLAAAVTLLLVAAYSVGSMRLLRVRSRLPVEFWIAVEGRRTGDALTTILGNIDPPPSVGVVTAGGLKLAYAGEVVDLLGLNNVAMAHNGGSRQGMRNHAAFEKSTFFELRPQIILPERASAGWHFDPKAISASWVNTVLAGLLEDVRFKDQYQHCSIRLRESTNPRVVGWCRRDFVVALGADLALLVTTNSVGDAGPP